MCFFGLSRSIYFFHFLSHSYLFIPIPFVGEFITNGLFRKVEINGSLTQLNHAIKREDENWRIYFRSTAAAATERLLMTSEKKYFVSEEIDRFQH